MPKDGKPDAEWHRAMQEFAQSRAKTMPRGRAPPKKSKWYSVMVKIINCPFGTRHVLRPTEVRGCECGYHQPKAAASPVPQGSEAKCPTAPLITTTFPKKPDSLLVGDIRGKNGFAPQAANTLRVYLYGPTIGQCTSCHARDMRVNAVSKLKLIYTDSWPIFAQGLDLKCKKCGCHCTTFDGNYIKTLPRHMQNMPFVAYGAAFGVGKSLILALRLGTAAKNLEEQVRANLTRDYTACKRNYEHDAARKVELKIASGYEPYGNFPEEFVPKSPALLQALLSDYYQHRDSLRREQRALRSTTALGIDHQAKVVGRVKKDPTGQAVGTQSFSIVGDLGLVLGYYVVPDTSGVWLEKAMTEVLDRHGETVPPIVYVDCNCCNGKLRSTHDEPAPSPDQKVGGWETRVVKKLDIMHLLLRVGREINGEHVRRARFLKQLSQAVFTDSSEDTKRLEEIRAKADLNLTAEQKRIDRYRYVRRVVGSPEAVCAKLLLVTKAHIALDEEARRQCLSSGMPVQNITPASPAYPLVTAKVKKAIFNQCIHVLNRCVSDNSTMYVCIGERDYRSTGEVVVEYKSLRGTSKVEAVHSVLSRSFNSFRNFRTEILDARATWAVTNYNRRRLRAVGRPSLPCGVAPVEVDDALLAPELSPEPLLFGFEYARAVTQIDVAPLDGEPCDEDDIVPENDQIDDCMERDEESEAEEDVNIPLSSDLTALDIPDHVTAHTLDILDKRFDEVIGQSLEDERDKDGVTEAQPTMSTMPGATTPSQPSALELMEALCQSRAAAVDVSAQWINTDALRQAQVTSKRNVARRRSLGGSLVEVRPDFNQRMKTMWIDIWSHLSPSSGGKPISQLVWSALAEYNRRVSSDLEGFDNTAENIPPPLLPVSYGHALTWMKDQRRLQQLPAQRGIFNEEAMIINEELAKTLVSPQAEDEQHLDLPEALIPDLIETVVDQAGIDQDPAANLVEPDPTKKKSPQRCRTCGELLGKLGHPRGKCPLKVGDSTTPAVDIKSKTDGIDPRRRARAEQSLEELGIIAPWELPKGEKRCPMCRMSRSTGHIIKNNRVIYCQYADTDDVKKEAEEQMHEKKKARYARYNEVRRGGKE